MNNIFQNLITNFRPTTSRYGYIKTIEKYCPIHGTYQSTVTGALAPNTTFEQGKFINVLESECPICKEEEAINKTKETIEEAFWLNNYELAGVPQRFKEASFKKYEIYDEKQNKAIELCKGWIKDNKYNLIFLGRGGTGKSNLLCASIRNLAYARKGVKYITEEQFCSEIKASYSDNNLTELSIMKKYVDYDYLVIDELGRSVGTQKDLNLISTLIIKRYENLKHTAIASNLTQDKLKERLDEHVYRKLTESCDILFAVWESYKPQ